MGEGEGVGEGEGEREGEGEGEGEREWEREWEWERERGRERGSGRGRGREGVGEGERVRIYTIHKRCMQHISNSRHVHRYTCIYMYMYMYITSCHMCAFSFVIILSSTERGSLGLWVEDEGQQFQQYEPVLTQLGHTQLHQQDRVIVDVFLC